MATYTRVTSGDFTVTISLPSDHADGGDIIGMNISNQDPVQAIQSFDGKKFMPGLPKTSFQAQILFLKSAPWGQGISDTDIGDTYGSSGSPGLTFDEVEASVTLTSLSWQTQDQGEGIKGIVIAPTYQYIGTRDSNCPTSNPSP